MNTDLDVNMLKWSYKVEAWFRDVLPQRHHATWVDDHWQLNDTVLVSFLDACNTRPAEQTKLRDELYHMLRRARSEGTHIVWRNGVLVAKAKVDLHQLVLNACGKVF